MQTNELKINPSASLTANHFLRFLWFSQGNLSGLIFLPSVGQKSGACKCPFGSSHITVHHIIYNAPSCHAVYESTLLPVRFFCSEKKATPERFEFRFNPLNRNVFVKRKPNLLRALRASGIFEAKEKPCGPRRVRRRNCRCNIRDYSGMWQ